MTKQEREEQAAYEEELKRHNDLCQHVRDKGRCKGPEVIPPPLNKDGSLKKEDNESDK